MKGNAHALPKKQKSSAAHRDVVVVGVLDITDEVLDSGSDLRLGHSANHQ